MENERIICCMCKKDIPEERNNISIAKESRNGKISKFKPICSKCMSKDTEKQLKYEAKIKFVSDLNTKEKWSNYLKLDDTELLVIEHLMRLEFGGFTCFEYISKDYQESAKNLSKKKFSIKRDNGYIIYNMPIIYNIGYGEGLEGSDNFYFLNPVIVNCIKGGE